IQVPLAGGLGGALLLQLLTRLADLRGECEHALRGRFKLQSELALLAAESFQLQNSGGGFVMQALRFAIERSNAFFGLGDAVAHRGSRGNRDQNRVATLLLLTLDFQQRGCRCRSPLLPSLRLLLS